jgi:hypothetical protein
LAANGVVLCSLSKFWQRETNTSAFCSAGSSGPLPAARKASIKKLVFDRSGRFLLP